MDDHFIPEPPCFHFDECAMLTSRRQLKAEGKDWLTILAEQEKCDCAARGWPTLDV
jgi:hypothetical protein